MITCKAYIENGKTYYTYIVDTGKESIINTKESVGTLARAEFLACIDALNLANSLSMKHIRLQVNSKAIYFHTKTLSALAKKSDLFRLACVLKLLIDEMEVKIQLVDH